MKIVHLIFSLNLGGAEAMLIDIINQQVYRNEVTLCIINKAYNEKLLDNISNEVQIILLNRKESSRDIKDLFRLNICIYKIKPDIIHCHDSNIIKYLLFSSHYCTILTVHDTKLPLKGINKFKHIIAISSSVATMLQNKGMTNISIIYNAVNAKNINAKQKYQYNSCIRIIQVSRLEHLKKGQHLTIKALALLKRKLPHIQVDIDFIGTGSSKNYLEKLAKSLDVSNNIHFLGIRNREYVYSHLKDYDLLVQPSIYEGFGLTVAEGMIAGLPVLVSDVEGPMEIIQNGQYGYCFQVGNAEDMANKLVEMLQNPIKVYEIARIGQVYATSHFDIKELVLKYDELYKKSLK
ncbi:MULTISPECIES: glycosyltransferase [Bacteroides]|mgnify:CR=1 FL=1|uniref:glycosyltransferase n=1 Tax=Bacteroides TaxID=816 RepID=UPI00036D9F80|nr:MULTISPECIES: glycosyltransferase [Bacteroides]EOA58194.1 hypothetical protein HMPREF1214_02288 [Bacteroides sp. HPS0048]